MKNSVNPSLELKPPALREVSLKVARVNGVNLGQGVCMMPVPEVVAEGARRAITDGRNLYGPAQGILQLREALAERFGEFNRIPCTAENVLVTTGATGAFETICTVFLRPGDEVVTFRPFYPYHRNPLVKAGAKIRYVDMDWPTWEFDEERLRAAFSERTRFLLLNTPNNPTGKVFRDDELEMIARVCREKDVFCVTDEVYEYMTYDGQRHRSLASIEGMAERCITMGSYSKTFAITGWRVGYLIAPLAVMESLRTIFDQIYVCSPTPFQYAVLQGLLHLKEEYYSWMHTEYTRKRELMRIALEGAGLKPVIPQGTYYMLAETGERFPGSTSEEVVDMLIERSGVGAVPASDFMGPEVKGDPARSNFMRFCYAVADEQLQDAADRLQRLNS